MCAWFWCVLFEAEEMITYDETYSQNMSDLKDGKNKGHLELQQMLSQLQVGDVVVVHEISRSVNRIYEDVISKYSLDLAAFKVTVDHSGNMDIETPLAHNE